MSKRQTAQRNSAKSDFSSVKKKMNNSFSKNESNEKHKPTYNVNERLEYYVNCTKVYLQEEEESQVKSYQDKPGTGQNIKIQDFLLSEKQSAPASADFEAVTERNGINCSYRKENKANLDTERQRMSSEKKQTPSIHQKPNNQLLKVEIEPLRVIQGQNQQQYSKAKPIDNTKRSNELNRLKEVNQQLEIKATQRKEIMRQLYDILQDKEKEIHSLRKAMINLLQEFEMKMLTFGSQVNGQIQCRTQQLDSLAYRIESSLPSHRNLMKTLGDLEEKQRKLELIVSTKTQPNELEELRTMLDFVKQEKELLLYEYSSATEHTPTSKERKKKALSHEVCEKTYQHVLGLLSQSRTENDLLQSKLENFLNELMRITNTEIEEGSVVSFLGDIIGKNISNEQNSKQRISQLEEENRVLHIKVQKITLELSQVQSVNQQHISKLQEINQEYDILIKEKNAQLKEWQQKAQQSKLIGAELDQQIQSQREEIKALKALLGNIDLQQKQNDNETILGLKKQLDEQKEIVKNMEQEINLLQQCLLKCQKLESIINELTESLNHNTAAKKLLEETMQCKQDQNISQRSEIQQLKSLLQSSENQLQVSQQQLETQTIQNHLIQQQNDHLKNEYQFLQQKYESTFQIEKQKSLLTQQEVAQLKKLNDSLTAELMHLHQQQEQELKQHEEVVKELKQQVNFLKESLCQETYEQYIIDLNEMVTKKEVVLNQQQNIIDDLQKKYDSLSQQYMSNPSQPYPASSQSNLVTGITSSQINQLLDKELHDNIDNQSLEVSCQESDKNIQSQIESMQKEVAILMQDVQTLENQLIQTLKDKDNMEEILSNTQQENESLRTDLTSQNKMLDVLMSAISQILGQQNQMNDITQLAGMLKEFVNDMVQSLSNLKDQNKELEIQLRDEIHNKISDIVLPTQTETNNSLDDLRQLDISPRRRPELGSLGEQLCMLISQYIVSESDREELLQYLEEWLKRKQCQSTPQFLELEQ